MTLEEYLEKEESNGNICFELNIMREGDEMAFYIHPFNADGETCDFKVSENELTQIRNGVC